MRKRSGTFMLGILLVLGAGVAVGSPAAAADESATISDPRTGTFTLADGTIATATISGDESRTFGAQGKTLSSWSGTDAMYASGVSASTLPVLDVHSRKNCGTAKRCGEGQITVEFDRPVDDPAIHIAEFGAGTGGAFGWSAADGIRFASADGGATKAVVSDGATFVDGGDGYFRGDVRINCTASPRPGGCGSFTVPGTKITKIVFDVARFGLSPSQTAGLDAYALGVTATATATPTPTPTPTATPTATPTPEPEPKLAALTVSKVVDKAAAVPGDTLDYTITVSNTGEAAAHGVPVTDTLPSGLTDATADQGGAIADGRVSWTIDSIPAGEQSLLHVTGTVDRSTAGSMLVNRAVAKNPADAPEKTPAPVSTTPCTDDAAAACATTAVTALPALSISKVVDKQVAGHGESLSYTLVVANSGTAAVAGVPVVDMLPAALTGVTADQGGVVADGAVRWTLPEVAAGGSVELHVSGTTPAGLEEAQLVNRAAVQNPADAPAGSPAPTAVTPCPDDPQQACAVTAVAPAAALEISKTVAQATAQAGAILDYTITVANTGPGTATQIPVVDDLPDGARFIAASTGGAAVKDRVGWVIPELGSGATATLTLRVQVPANARGEITNRATVAYDATMIEALRDAAEQAGIAVPEDLSGLPALPPLTAAHPCQDDAGWSCAVTAVRVPAPAGLAQTGGTILSAIPAVVLLVGGALLLVLGARRKSNR